MNALQEVVEHIGDREVICIQIMCESIKIAGTLDEVLPLMDFDYENGYGRQELFGTIWYSDGTWSERAEYDGSEWWEHRQCPPLPNK